MARQQTGWSRQKCSKMTDWTIKQNNLETELLKEQTKQLQKEYIFNRMLRRCEMIELKNELLSIPKVQNNAPISAERKRFLRRHGIQLDERQKEYDIDYFIRVIDQLIGSDQPEQIEKIDKSEKIGFQRMSESQCLRLDFADDMTKMNENQNNGTQTIFHSDSEDESQPSSRSKPTTTIEQRDISTSGTDIEQQPCEQKGNKKKTSSASRPRHMFRTIDPPRRGRPLGNQVELKDEHQMQVDKDSQLLTNSKADVDLNEEANSYRCKVLAAHKLQMELTPCTSLQLRILNR